jgi:hypothetical protein
MICLLFVISVALLEAILHYDEKKQHQRKVADREERRRAQSNSDPADPVTQGLLSLVQALQNPDSNEIPVERAGHTATHTATAAVTEEKGYNRSGAGTE